jgi:cytidylate kinase
MGVVTISRQHGSDGRTVGVKAAESLGYQYMGKELIVRVALEADLPVSEVEAFDEQPEHPIMRAVRKFLAPPYPGAAAGLAGEDTQKIMLRLANEGNVVLMGRGSQAALADREDALHVRIVAPEAFRIATVMGRDDLGAEDAAREIKRVDELRERYIKRHYGVTAADTEYYHLVINTGLCGVEAASEMVADALRRLLPGEG